MSVLDDSNKLLLNPEGISRRESPTKNIKSLRDKSDRSTLLYHYNNVDRNSNVNQAPTLKQRGYQ